MSDQALPPDPSRPPTLPATAPATDPRAAFDALVPRLHTGAFRLGGLHAFSGRYRLVEADDVEDAVIIAREGDGQRLGLSIVDFLDAYRQGYNT